MYIDLSSIYFFQDHFKIKFYFKIYENKFSKKNIINRSYRLDLSFINLLFL